MTEPTATTSTGRRRSRFEAINARADARLAAINDAIERQRIANQEPVYSEHSREKLAVHLRNLEVLTQEIREVVDVGGQAVNLLALIERTKSAEGTLAWAVESAAQGAGLVVA